MSFQGSRAGVRMRFGRKAGTLGKMAAKSFTSRLRGTRPFLSGFVAGAVVGAAGAGLTALQFFRNRGAEAALAVREPEGKPVVGSASPSPGFGAARRPRAALAVHAARDSRPS